VLMSFIGRCDPDINLDNKIYFCLLHNQGGRFKIISTIGHVLCVLLFTNEFMPSVLIAVLIFLRSQASSGFHRSMFQHCVTSTGCLIRLSLGDPASTTIKTAMKTVGPTTLALRKKANLQQLLVYSLSKKYLSSPGITFHPHRYRLRPPTLRHLSLPLCLHRF
jgi:hypothetical protein